MKQVIREGVFETNSSSTHAFVLYNTQTKQPVDKKFAAKHKPEDTEEPECISEQSEIAKAVESFLSELKMSKKKDYDNCSFRYVTPEGKLFWLAGVIMHACCQYCNCGQADNCEDEALDMLFEGDDAQLDLPKRFFACCMAIYKDGICLTDKQVIKQIIYDKLGIGEMTDQNKQKLLASYYYYPCQINFNEGSLDECYCNFSDLTDIALNLKLFDNAERLEEYAKEFLSDDYAVCAYEYWNGVYLVNYKGEF